MSLESRIKHEASRLGFIHAGITTAEPPPHFNVYERWLEGGLHGEMHYLAAQQALQRRADPRQILPDCESILTLAFPYHPAGAAVPVAVEHGRVAAYALGDDYHDVLRPRLQALAAFIDAEAGRPVASRWYTDTGPVMERDFAQRAGLGWIGKNTCLIHPDHGSNFILAEILLGILLQPDAPFTSDHCGTCTRCIDACPTRCILPDRTIDATRCISYLTIELKGTIPLDLRPGIGNWIFGCDICQQVCPWNERFAPAAGDPALAPRDGVEAPLLAEELALTAEAFNLKFKGSPVQRAKRRGYLRNVAVALGNAGRPESVQPLHAALRNDPEPLVRGHAAWALGRIATEAARAALAAEADLEQDPSVRWEIEEALKGFAET